MTEAERLEAAVAEALPCCGDGCPLKDGSHLSSCFASERPAVLALVKRERALVYEASADLVNAESCASDKGRIVATLRALAEEESRG